MDRQMSDIGQLVFDTAAAMNTAASEAHRQGKAEGLREAVVCNKALIAALRPFVIAYRKAADPIGDSDLYPEQPRHVTVSLGDCRKAALVLDAIDRAGLPKSHV